MKFPLRLTFAVALLSMGSMSCNSKKESSGGEQVAADTDPEQVDLSPVEEFIAICEKSGGSAPEQEAAIFLKSDLQARFNQAYSCQDVYDYYNTPSTPGSDPVYLDLIGPAFFEDLSIFRFLGNLESMVINTVTISDWASFGHLAKLNNIVIINSGLTAIPAEWEGLTSLSSLIVQDAELKDIANIASIKTLANLTLVQMSLDDHSAIGELSSLNGLILGATGLTAIPESWSGLSVLELFIVQQEPLADITNLGGVVSLKDIEFAQTAITDFSALGSMKGLTSLFLQESGITSVPATWSGLTALQTLVVLDDSLTDITNLSSVTTIQGMELSGNAIANFDPIGSLTNLQVLIVGNAGLTAIPATWSTLTGLLTLFVHTEAVFDMTGVSAFTTLQRLDLISANVATLTDISALVNLQSLNLQGNEAIDLATNFATVPANLVVLLIQNVGITAVPNVAAITGLTGLAVDGNALLTDYTTLNGNTTIKQLTMAQNALAAIPAEVTSIAQLEAFGAANNTIASVVPVSSLAALAAVDFSGNPIDATKTPDNCPADALSPAIKTYCSAQ